MDNTPHLEETPLSQQDSLQLIQSMINRARDNFSEDGMLYLLWGWVILISSLGEFVLLQIFHVWWHFMVWWITWVALIYQVVYLRRKRKRAKVKTYSEGILAIVWIGFFVTLVLVAFVVGSIFNSLGKDFYAYLTPIILALYGFPTFVSGFVLQFRPLKAGGIACWIFSIISALLPPEYQILMLAPAVFVAWVLPGYQLRARYRKLNQPQHGF